MNVFVGLSLAKGAPSCETERGVIRPGETLMVPVEMAATLLARDPDGWVIASREELVDVVAEIKRRAAPATDPALVAGEEN